MRNVTACLNNVECVLPFLKCKPVILIGIVWWMFLPNEICAQNQSSEDVRRIAEVRITGQDLFPENELLGIVQTEANRRLLGVPRLTPWLWVYRWGERSRLPSRFREAIKRIGEPPAILDEVTIQKDAERLELYFRQRGYRSVSVTPSITRSSIDSSNVRVTYSVDPGRATWVRSFTYDGLESLPPERLQSILKGSIPRLRADSTVQVDAFKTRFVGGQRFIEPDMYDERRRLISLLRDEGYAALTRDSIQVILFPFHPDSFDVTMRIRMGNRFRVGSLTYNVAGPEQVPTRIDTLARTQSGPAIVSKISNERRLDPLLLRSLTTIRPGEWYNQSKLLETKRFLDGTGLFAFSTFSPQWLAVDSASMSLPIVATLRTQKRRLVRTESFAQLRGDFETWEGGLGGSYTNLNLLGKGEQFQFRVSGALAVDFQNQIFPAYQLDASPAVIFPYLVRPFRRLARLYRVSPNDTRTRVSLRFLTSRRDALNLRIRARGEAQYQMEIRHSPVRTSIIDMVDFSLSDPDTLSGFSDSFFSVNIDPLQRERLLEEYSRPQINNALRYALRTSTADPLRRDRGFTHQWTMEIGGNLPYLLDRFVYTPDSLEGYLSGSRAGKLLYRQYVRLTADWRVYRPVSGRSVLAWKLAGGVAHPIGKEPSIPFDRRFILGEAFGIRGWDTGSLGPGASTENVRIVGGEIKLEGSLELRTIFARKLFAADWMIVPFVDAGNMWYGPRNENPDAEAGRFRFTDFYRQIGVGSGLGLRIAWEYLILRFDWGWQVRSPEPDTGIFPAGRVPNFHFNIGHAF